MIYCNKCQWKARLSNIIDKLCANNSNAVFIQKGEKIFNDYSSYEEVYKILLFKTIFKMYIIFYISIIRNTSFFIEICNSCKNQLVVTFKNNTNQWSTKIL